jgi:hypothetical protein
MELHAPPRLLLHGLDTVQCCYYLTATPSTTINFEKLLAQREHLRLAQTRDPEPLILGGEEFLLSPNGSRSGYPLVISNRTCRIEFGEHIKPSFFVTYRSEALWNWSLRFLQYWFLAWARELGLEVVRPETLSRVDFTFDYHLPTIDFDEDSFVSLSTKDAQHRQDGLVQTFTFGRSDVVLRVYDKVAEVWQQSDKRWLFKLWERDTEVWRIEWQVRKKILRRFGIRTTEDLYDRYGDVLRYLVSEHDSLRSPTADTNRSRWPLHPLWDDLRSQIANLDCLGVYREERLRPPCDEQLARLVIQIYGYLKRAAALEALRTGKPILRPREVLAVLGPLLEALHDPFTWRLEVNKRIKQAELGRWSS